MKEFVLSALPWVIIAITIAVALKIFNKQKQIRNIAESKDEFEHKSIVNNETKVKEDYMLTGMIVGMCFGVAISSLFINTFGLNIIAYGICFGLLGGMIVGVNIKRK